MRMNILAAVALAAMAVTAAPAGAAQFYASAHGWVRSDGFHYNSNTFTGNSDGERLNSWAAFDIPVGVYNAADLQLTLNGYGDVSNDLLGIYDVSSPFSVLQNGPTTSANYTDLGTGSQYATFNYVDSTPFIVHLSGNFIADVNAAAGGKLIIGFTNLTKNAIPSGNTQDGVYTSQLNFPFLKLTEGTPVVPEGTAGVPEPASWALMISGFGLAGAALRRRRPAVAA